jgi:ubiquinone/menaquinone biosynthesis C-methylase UbiE
MSLELQYQNSKNLEARIAIFKYAKVEGSFWESVAQCYPWKLASKVLELGCGTGDFWVEASKYIPPNSELLLTDFSDGMLAKAKEKLSHMPVKISFEKADANNLIYPAQAFDVVISHFMLYHINSPENLIDKVRGLLKPGAWFGVVLPVRTDKFASYLELAFEIRPELKQAFLDTSVAKFLAQDFEVIAKKKFSKVDVRQLPGSEIVIPDIEPIVAAVKSFPVFQSSDLEEFFREYRDRLAKIILSKGAVRDTLPGTSVFVCHNAV